MVLLDHPLDYTMPMVMDLVNGEGTGLNFRHEKPGALIAEIHRVAPSRAENPDAYDDQCSEDSKIRLAELLLERLPLAGRQGSDGVGPGSTRNSGSPALCGAARRCRAGPRHCWRRRRLRHSTGAGHWPDGGRLGLARRTCLHAGNGKSGPVLGPQCRVIIELRAQSGCGSDKFRRV